MLKRLLDAEATYKAMPKDELEKLVKLPDSHLLGEVDAMAMLIRKMKEDPAMCKVVNRVFMSMVQSYYWNQMHHGQMRPGSSEAEILLTSVRPSLSPLTVNLTDYDFILSALPE